VRLSGGAPEEYGVAAVQGDGVADSPERRRINQAAEEVAVNNVPARVTASATGGEVLHLRQREERGESPRN
jgi:hypothetical protein